MFDSLDEQMHADDLKAESNKSRYMRWAIAGLSGLVVLAGLFLGVHFLS